MSGISMETFISLVPDLLDDSMYHAFLHSIMQHKFMALDCTKVVIKVHV